MPKSITEIKSFLTFARHKSAKYVTIVDSKKAKVIKFKIRVGKYLYTLCVADKEKANRLKQSLPPGLSVKEIGKVKK